MLVSGAILQAADAPTMGKGTHFDTLVVGKKTYTNVEVRQVTVRSILISDTDGIASIPMHELSPSLQLAFGYEVALEEAADAKLATVRQHTNQRIAQQRAEHEAQLSEAVATKFNRLLASFAHAPVMLPSIDLRSHFREMSLGIKNQGKRPSCSVFAILSAYEFQNAELLGTPEKLSEDYLIWATNFSSRQAASQRAEHETESGESAEGKDIGFSLPEVVAALRTFGVAPQSAMPDTFTKIEEIPTPSNELIEQSSKRRKLTVHYIRGNDTPSKLGNIVQALNEEVPVPIGLRWPHPRTLRTGYIDNQAPVESSLHAVTLVGYVCPSGEIEETIFIFKNSYGPNWGEAGYGRVTYKYLSENLLDAVVLEVQRPDAVSPSAK